MAATLSEKAKGKLRAVDPTATDEPVSKALTIRFTEGIPDLTIEVVVNDTVKDIKNRVCASLRETCHSLTLM